MIKRAMAVAVILQLLLVAPATAHDDVGELTLVTVEPISDDTARFEVRLAYSGDKEPVPDAALTVVGTLAGGVTVGPQALMPLGAQALGHYEAEITFPPAGAWNLTFNGLTPRATLSVVHQVGSAKAASTTASLPAITMVPVPEDDEGTSAAGAALVGAAAAIVVAGSVFAVRRWRRR